MALCVAGIGPALLLWTQKSRDAGLRRCLQDPGGVLQAADHGDPTVEALATWLRRQQHELQEARHRIQAAAETHRLRAGRLQDAFDAHPAPVILWDGSRRGRVWWANPAALAMLPSQDRHGGEAPSTAAFDQVVGMPIAELLPRATMATLAADGGIGSGLGPSPRTIEDLPWGKGTVDAVVFPLGAQKVDGAAGPTDSPGTSQSPGPDPLEVPGGFGLTWTTGVSADALQRAKDAVLSCVSHELRTPLTNVQAYAELLQGLDPEDRDSHAEFTQVVVQESQRMANRIDRIMDLARLQADQIRWRFDRLDLGTWFGERLRSWRPILESRGLELVAMAGGEVGSAVVDVRWLNRLLDELLRNAHDHAGTGGRVICELHGTGVPGGGEGVVHLSVHDDGAGVAPEERDRLGAAFEQVAAQDSGKPEGLGLGLALAERVVARHGGNLWLDASPLGGLAAHILLPRRAHRIAPSEEPLDGVATGSGDANLPPLTSRGDASRSVIGPLTQR